MKQSVVARNDSRPLFPINESGNGNRCTALPARFYYGGSVWFRVSIRFIIKPARESNGLTVSSSPPFFLGNALLRHQYDLVRRSLSVEELLLR